MLSPLRSRCSSRRLISPAAIRRDIVKRLDRDLFLPGGFDEAMLPLGKTITHSIFISGRRSISPILMNILC